MRPGPGPPPAGDRPGPLSPAHGPGRRGTGCDCAAAATAVSAGPRNFGSSETVERRRPGAGGPGPPAARGPRPGRRANRILSHYTEYRIGSVIFVSLTIAVRESVSGYAFSHCQKFTPVPGRLPKFTESTEAGP